MVSIIGVVTSGSPYILVLAYCDHGSLLSKLRTRAAAGNPLPLAHKLELAGHTARGMQHLSGHHTTLRATNKPLF